MSRAHYSGCSDHERLVSDYPPPMTRCSTAQETEAVTTPEDDCPHRSEYVNGYTGKHRDSCSDVTKSRLHHSSLERHGTTKALIGRYESLATPAKPHGSRPSAVPSSRALAYKGQLTSPTRMPEKKAKGRSPIRQSFRNILSVFSKKGRYGRDDPFPVAAARQKGTNTHENPAPRSTVLRLGLDIPSSQNRGDVIECNTPAPLHSGTLLYLFHATSADILPVWTTCTAVLHSFHVLLTWHTASGNPSTSVVALANCTDVTSRETRDLNETERGLLPAESDIGAYKIFEMVFEGRPKEKFAAISVTDRAAWINAIWDAILQAQEGRSYLFPPAVQDISRFDTQLDRGVLEDVGPPSPVSSMQADEHSPMSVHSQRALPSLPGMLSPIRISLYDAPVPQPSPPPTIPSTPQTGSASPSTATSDSKFLSTPFAPRTQSPSIRNLDQRSMVKQRLAEIERSSIVVREAPSTLRSTRSRQYKSSQLTPTVSVVKSARALMRQESRISSNEDSIIESYAETYTRSNSPASMSSGRLTTIAATSRAPSMHEYSKLLDPKQARSHHHQSVEPDLFSPQSQYSTDNAPEVPPKIPTMFTTTPSERISGLPIETNGSPFRIIDDQDRTTSLPPINSPRPSQASIINAVPMLEKRLAELEVKVPSDECGTNYDQHYSVPAVMDLGLSEAVQSIESSIRRIEELQGIGADDIPIIKTQLNTILAEIREQTARLSVGHTPNPANAEFTQIAARLDEVGIALSDNLPELVKKIEGLRDLQLGSNDLFTARNIASSRLQEDDTDARVPEATEIMSLAEKIDDLSTICHALQENSRSGHAKDGDLQEILTLLQAEQRQRIAQGEQQADNARYLNELNTWLEAFVRHGSSQIDTMSTDVQQLCKELGPVMELQDSAPEEAGEGQRRGNLLADIRQFLIQCKEREDNTNILQASVNGLMAAVQEDLRRNAEARNTLTTESIIGIVERQRQDQERMLRALASDLSNDIRGERLRFVEAMKEATAINVQIHVEEFKKELTREVLLMTQEVGRLQRERQTLEQQIADLFAFYAKQKQAAKVPQGGGTVAPTPRRAMTSMGRRPLPTPSPGPSMPAGF
ncbi:hypothetical protein K474DRAFT_1773484 [Panus rudis PR-1116 ss-1]|nr:hypothetical protein K474DRAFT_1773484 [Panus rudis PR-1116 ss-1]